MENEIPYWKKRGFASHLEYDDWLAKKRGYESFSEYQEEFAKKHGYESFSDYIYSKQKERIALVGTPIQRLKDENKKLCLIIDDILNKIPEDLKEKYNIQEFSCEKEKKYKTLRELIWEK